MKVIHEVTFNTFLNALYAVQLARYMVQSYYQIRDNATVQTNN